MFLRQTGKTTGKKGSVCFFSLELNLGAVPCGEDRGAAALWHQRVLLVVMVGLHGLKGPFQPK